MLGVGAILRFAGLNKDLWLDEVWALRVATDMRSPLAVFTLHHEINHHLMTLWLYLVGTGAPAGLYHLPSYLFGVGAIAVAALIGFRRSIAAGIATTIVFACSYELIAYSTEARGYSAVTFASLLGLYSLERLRAEGGIRWRVTYWLASILGILSHPIYAAVLGAGIAYTAWMSEPRRPAVVVRDVIATHAVPVAALGLLWFIDLRLVVAGGGTPAKSLTDVYGGALAWGIGTLDSSATLWICAILAVALISGALRNMRATDGATALFFLCAIVVFPVALVLVRNSDLVYTRHFMIASLFVLLLLGLTIGRWWDQGRRALPIVTVIAFVAVNGVNVRILAKNGRGQYRAAIAYMAQSARGDTVTIAGDQDFRIGSELEYYLPRASTTKRLEYFQQGSWPSPAPEWLVIQRESFDHSRPEDRIDLGPGLRYVRNVAFPTSPLSGLHWYIYHHEADE